jgi:hypothetical protein
VALKELIEERLEVQAEEAQVTVRFAGNGIFTDCQSPVFMERALVALYVPSTSGNGLVANVKGFAPPP